MKTWLGGAAIRARNIAFGLGVLALSGAANASLIVNGDFSAGDLSGWTTFTTTNGTIGSTSGLPDVVSFDTNGDTTASQAARFEVGQVSFQSGVPLGGGIYQSFVSGAGALTISLDIATQQTVSSSNASGGIFSLILDGVVVDTEDFGVVNALATERGSLSYAGAVGAGSHEVRILMVRPFQTGADVGGTPVQYIYIDDVVANVVTMSVPEPTTLALLGLGLAGLAVARRRKQ